MSLLNANYKKLELVKGAQWYVKFYLRVPDELFHVYKKKWKRFRVKEDINRYEGEEKEEYGQLLLNAVKIVLADTSFNPFEYLTQVAVKNKGQSLTIALALDFAAKNIAETGVDPVTVQRYTRVIDLIREYLKGEGYLELPPHQVDSTVITECFQHYKKTVPWGNKNYNIQFSYACSIFAFLKKKKKIDINPCENYDQLPTISRLHKYYDAETGKKILEYAQQDISVLTSINCIYYAAVRSGKELMRLQVGDILIDRDRIRFRGEAVKNKRDDYIVLDPKLKAYIIEKGLHNYPSNYYIANPSGIPSAKMASTGWLQKKYREMRKLFGLSTEYTVYSWKHTRAVHLLMDGAKPRDIMQLFRHKDLSTTSKYIRDLGFDMDAEFTELSRDI